MNFSRQAHITILLMRISMGIMFFYDGYQKLIDKSWTALPYLQNAKSFEGFYDLLSSTSNLWWVNQLNIWGPILIGIALVIGFRVRLVSFLGIILLLLYYFPVLQFPYVLTGGFLVDRHIIYGLVLFLFIATRAGEFFGLDAKVDIIVKT